MKNIFYSPVFYVVWILLIGFGLYNLNYYQSEMTIEVTINSKERVSNGKSSKYLVFSDRETLKCTDEWLMGKFNSSDIYGRLKEGRTYKLRVIGFRWPMMSWYRNILSAHEVKNEKMP